MSLPQLKHIGGKERKTNIIIKGAFSTKAPGTTKSKKLTTATKKSSTAKKEKTNSDLMEKLLTEITAKYKHNLCKDQAYLQRLEKKTMI